MLDPASMIFDPPSFDSTFWGSFVSTRQNAHLCGVSLDLSLVFFIWPFPTSIRCFYHPAGSVGLVFPTLCITVVVQLLAHRAYVFIFVTHGFLKATLSHTLDRRKDVCFRL